jgi:hypothetical protein
MKHGRIRPLERKPTGSAKAPRASRGRRKPEAYPTTNGFFTKSLSVKLNITLSSGAFATLTASRGPGEIVGGNFAERPRRHIFRGNFAERPRRQSFHREASDEFGGAPFDQSASIFCKLLQLHLFRSKVAKHEVSNSILDTGVLRVPSALFRASFGMIGLKS